MTSKRNAKTVTLVHPDGQREYEASTPRELNDLVAGRGYAIKGGASLAEAAEALAGTAAAAAESARPSAGGGASK